MIRSLLAAVTFSILCAATASAGEIKATIKKVDVENKQLTVSVGDGDDQTFTVAKDADIFRLGQGKKNKPGPKQPITGGLTGLSAGNQVTLMTFKSGTREIVSSIQVDPTAVKKKPKNP